MNMGHNIVIFDLLCALAACSSFAAGEEAALTNLTNDLFVVSVAQYPIQLRLKHPSHADVGKEVQGLTIVKYEPKSKEAEIPGIGKTTVDVSEITLRRGDETITLVAGKEVEYKRRSLHNVSELQAGKERLGVPDSQD